MLLHETPANTGPGVVCLQAPLRPALQQQFWPGGGLADMIDVAFHPLFRLDMGPLHYFSVLGRALFTAQRLEMNCRAIAGFLHMRRQITLHGHSVVDDPVFLKGIDELWRKTLGQHVSGLMERGLFSDPALSTIFRVAVQARNEIAHEVATDVSERLDFELHERIVHILALVRQIAEADKIAATILHVLNKDPLPTREFLVSYEDRVAGWVSENTFEDQSRPNTRIDTDG
jgi:hypothetical protein